MSLTKPACSLPSANQPPSRSQIDLYLNPALFCFRDPPHVRAQPLKVISIPKSAAAVAQSTIQIFSTSEPRRPRCDRPLGSSVAKSGPLSHQKDIRLPCLLERYLTFLIFFTRSTSTPSARADQTVAARAALPLLSVLIPTCARSRALWAQLT